MSLRFLFSTSRLRQQDKTLTSGRNTPHRRHFIRFSGSRAGILCSLLVMVASLAAPLQGQAPPKSMVKACNKGDAENCYWAGINQSAKNPPEARRYFSLGCAGNYRKACKELHNASDELMDGSREDQGEANRHFETACGMNYARSCSSLASSYWDGSGIAVDKSQAVKLWQRGCEHGSRVGCRRAGTAFEKGEVVSQDSNRALSYFQKSCDGGLESACADAGRLLFDNGRVSEAAAPLTKACLDADWDDARGDACLTLGGMLSQGKGVPKDLPLAFKAWNVGCRIHHGASCFEAGNALASGLKNTLNQYTVEAFYGKACQDKSKDGCREICRLQCEQGQPYACERAKKKKWPWSLSCAMP